MDNEDVLTPASQPGDAAARAATVAEKTARDKAALVEQLRKTPVIQIACEKVGVSRMTFYRWKKDDEEFANAADAALADGKSLVNDLAESQLLSALKSGDPWSIQYWLRHHHAEYTNKLEITAKDERNAPLTPEQEELLKQGLLRSSLLPSNPDNESAITEQPAEGSDAPPDGGPPATQPIRVRES